MHNAQVNWQIRIRGKEGSGKGATADPRGNLSGAGIVLNSMQMGRIILGRPRSFELGPVGIKNFSLIYAWNKVPEHNANKEEKK